jgi:RNA polymerase sigma factor (sigma-70 family)
MAIPEFYEPSADGDLWQLVRQGSVPAFEALVRRYQSLVCAVAYNACGDLALSEDVAQEAFWAAWRERASLAEPGCLRGWLCGIARNLGHNARRRQLRTAGGAALDAATHVPARERGPAEEAVSREEEALVWQALAQMPESYREPLVLFYREEQSIHAVAAALELSEDAVKQRLSRGRGMLQERVAQLVEGALRRSRPGRPFTVAVVAGLATLSAGSKTALAGTGVAGAVAKAAGVGVGSGLLGAALGSLGGLLGAWFGAWLPAQLAPTRQERDYLWRSGKRMLLVALFFIAILTIPALAFPGQLAPVGSLVFWIAWMVAFWAYVQIEVVCLTRGVKRLRAEAVEAERNDAPLRVGLEAVASRYRGRVFRSRAMVLGLPLLDVNVTDPGQADWLARGRVARGWIAIGDEAHGILFALGGRAYGLIAVGGLAAGVVAVGGAALGLLAVGGGAVGVVAVGGGALGWQACGGVALAWDVACGGLAVAWHAAIGGAAVAHAYAVGGGAWAAHANDDLAKAVLVGHPFTAGFDWYAANVAWVTPVFVLSVLLCCIAPLPLMYRREAKPITGPGN